MTNKNYSSKITVPVILSSKSQNNSNPIAAVTAYDYTFARLVDAAGVDIVLVGDSLGCVIQGHPNTLPVTMDEMVYHTKCVSRGVERALVVADMPFASYQLSHESAITNAFKLIKEGSAAAVKLEGGVAMFDTIKRIVDCDIPVMGHVGLTPQSYHRMGGFRVQGKDNSSKIFEDALAVAEAGAFSIVIEGVPDDLASRITEAVKIPTIGIGAGIGCDGQILVVNDLLGLNDKKPAKFVKQYANLFKPAVEAVSDFVDEVKSKKFPTSEYSYGRFQ
jgi:3-methyl-2-oxobutanoate hydroxymethyltransferase